MFIAYELAFTGPWFWQNSSCRIGPRRLRTRCHSSTNSRQGLERSWLNQAKSLVPILCRCLWLVSLGWFCAFLCSWFGDFGPWPWPVAKSIQESTITAGTVLTTQPSQQYVFLRWMNLSPQFVHKRVGDRQVTNCIVYQIVGGLSR